MSHSKLSSDQLRHIAKLARLSLRDDEIEPLRDQLSSILAYMEQLNEVDTNLIEPTAQVGVRMMPLRDDNGHPSLPRESVLSASAETLDGCFAVPAFLDD